MPDFYKQYRFADNDAPIQDWDQFLNIRIGARLIKDTGDEYQKTDNHVYEKVARHFLSASDIEGKFAVLDGTNTFTDPQYCTAEPTEPYHIVNKEYVDALVATSAVDLSGFARLDRENIWEQPQLCNAEPENRAHLANKGYVDDRFNEIEFDTTGLARLNAPNTFTAPQSVTVESTAPEHLVTKQYVDNVRDSIINNITGFVRVDLPNTFTATQTFQATTIVPSPKTDTEAANKLYVDQKVSETQSKLGDFASLKLANTFEKDQTFRTNAICNLPPTMPYHLANKEYVDALAGSIELPDNLVALDVENVWLARQDFSSGITVPDPENGTDAANKDYVDRKLLDVEVEEATIDTAGIVMLAKPISPDSGDATQTVEEFEQNDTTVPTPKTIADYVRDKIPDTSLFVTQDGDNTFVGQNTFTNANVTELSAFNVIVQGSFEATDAASITGENGLIVTQADALIDGNRYIHVVPTDGSIPMLEDDRSPDELDSDEMDIKVVYKSGDFSQDDPSYPMPDRQETTLNVGNDVRFGTIRTSDYTEITGAMILPAEYQTGGDWDTGSTMFYIGLANNTRSSTNPELYPASNLTPPDTNTNNGLVTTKYLLRSPWFGPSRLKVELTKDPDKQYDSKYKFYKDVIPNSVDGTLRMSPQTFVTAITNGWITGSVTITGYDEVAVPAFNASELTSITISDTDRAVFDISHARHITLSNATDIELNVTNSTVDTSSSSGTINAAKNSHVIIKDASFTVNLSYYSTCDDLGATCEGSADTTSHFYSGTH